MAIAALAERLNVLQRGCLTGHMFAANPARHHAVKLTGYRFVDLVSGVAQSAHNNACNISAASALSPFARLGLAWLDE